MHPKAHSSTTAKTRRQPECPLAEEWIKKMWCIHTTEYCSAIKKNKVRPFAVTWMDPEMIVLSEEVRKRKTRNYITYRWNLKNDTGQYICETKIDAHTQQTDVWLLMGRRWGG